MGDEIQTGHDVAQKVEAGIKGVKQGKKDVADHMGVAGQTEISDGMKSFQEGMGALSQEWAADQNDPEKRARLLQTIKDDLSNSQSPWISNLFGEVEVVGFDDKTQGLILKGKGNDGKDHTMILLSDGSDITPYEAKVTGTPDPRAKTPAGDPKTPEGDPKTSEGDSKTRTPEWDPKAKPKFNTDAPFSRDFNELRSKAEKLEAAKKIELPPKYEEQVKKDLEEFKKKIDAGNFTFDIHKGDGPVPAMGRMRRELRKLPPDKLTPQQKALLDLPDSEVLKEGRRVRDRDFADPEFIKLHQKYGGDGKIYAVKDDTAVKRYTDADIKTMMDAKEAELRTEAAKKAAAEKVEPPKKPDTDDPGKTDLTARIDKSVPSLDIIKKAQDASGVPGKPEDIRENMKKQIGDEIKAGTLTAADLSKLPRVGTVFVATGAVTPEELKAGLAKQKEIADKNGGKALRIGDVLNDTFKDQPDKVKAIDNASTFYNMMIPQMVAEKATPSTDVITKAQSSAPVPDGAGTPEEIRGRMRDQIAQDVSDGTIKRDDIAKLPTNEQVYVGLGVVTPAELKDARQAQADQAKTGETKTTSDILREKFPDRKAKFDQADEYTRALQSEQKSALEAERAEAEHQTAIDDQIENSVPTPEKLDAALKLANIDGMDAGTLRGKIKRQMAQDVKDGVYKAEDYSKGPSFKSILLASGALDEAELAQVQQTLAKQQKTKPETKVDDVMAGMFKGDDAKLQKIKQAGALYDAITNQDAIEAAVPPKEKVQSSLQSAGLEDLDPAKVRDAMETQMFRDIRNHIYDSSAYANGPTRGAALVATGALQPEELKQAYQNYMDMAKARKDGDPQLDFDSTFDKIVTDIVSADPKTKDARLAQVKAGNDFFTALMTEASPPPEAKAELTGERAAKLTADDAGKITKEQLAQIKPDVFAKLPPEAVGALSADAMSALTGDQAARLTPQQAAKLTKAQIAAITADAFSKLSKDAILQITPDAISGMTADQADKLSAEQAGVFTAQQLEKIAAGVKAKLTKEPPPPGKM